MASEQASCPKGLDPILFKIIEKYRQECIDKDPETIIPTNDIGEFTNRIVLCKKQDLRYYFRLVVDRLNREFPVLPEESSSNVEIEP